jgi:hypothetical protein
LDHLVNPPAATFPAIWSAGPLGSSGNLPAIPAPADLGPDWVELGQAWRAAPEPGFNRGWGRIRWNELGLYFETCFLQRMPANLATGLNQRTWEMGDIAEFFLQETATGRYLELHVTPENQRLQLVWPLGGLNRFRTGAARLEDFLVTDPHWVRSAAQVQPDHWTASAHVPFACLGLKGSEPLPVLRAAVCRYDRSLGPELLSSTARLTKPNYHRHSEWAELRLTR